MVFTHIPSNLLLLLVPFSPSLPWAIGLLLARFSLSQMDVPARQAYIVSIVPPAERAGAVAFTGLVRGLGQAAGPLFSGGELQTIGESRVFVPTQLYKVVYLPARELSFAVVVDNSAPTKDYTVKTVHELETMSGLRFPGIPESLKDKRIGGLKGV